PIAMCDILCEMHNVRLACLLVLVGARPLLAALSCSPERTGHAITQVRQRQNLLLKQKVEAMGTEIAAPVRRQITALKAALAEAVDAEVACMPPSSEAAVIETRLAKRLKANQPEQPQTPQQTPAEQDSEPEDGVYGANLNVKVSAPANAPTKRAVE